MKNGAKNRKLCNCEIKLMPFLVQYRAVSSNKLVYLFVWVYIKQVSDHFLTPKVMAKILAVYTIQGLRFVDFLIKHSSIIIMK